MVLTLYFHPLSQPSRTLVMFLRYNNIPYVGKELDIGAGNYVVGAARAVYGAIWVVNPYHIYFTECYHFSKWVYMFERKYHHTVFHEYT